MKLFITVLLLSALTPLTALTALAEDLGPYVGGSIGSASLALNGNYFDDRLGDVRLDDSTSSWKTLLGFQLLPVLSVEGGYTRFGSVGDTNAATRVRLKADTLSLFARGILPVGPLQFFAKAGYHFYDASASLQVLSNDFSARGSESGRDFAFGAGAGVELGAFTIRTEYEIFLIDNFDDLTMVSIGATYSF